MASTHTGYVFTERIFPLHLMCRRRWSTVLAAQAQWTVWAVTSPSLACPSARAHRAARLTACLTPQTPPTITRARWIWWRKTKPSYPTAPWFTSNRFVHVHKVFTYLHYIYSQPKWLYFSSICKGHIILSHHYLKLFHTGLKLWYHVLQIYPPLNLMQKWSKLWLVALHVNQTVFSWLELTALIMDQTFCSLVKGYKTVQIDS